MLSVDTTPTGDAAGNVRSDPYLIDCPGACTRPYDPGTKVTLTEAPTRGFTFTAWSGATCDEGQTSSTCTFVITQDTHVVADYSGKYDPHVPDGPCCTLSVSVSGYEALVYNGTIFCGTPFLQWWLGWTYCSQTVAPGTEVTLYTGSWCDGFLGWSDTGGTSWTRSFKMTHDISVGAHYDGC
jgi:hypothetical protein